MNISEASRKLLQCKQVDAMAASALTFEQKPTASTQEVNAALAELESALEKNRFGSAVAIAIAMLLWDGDRTVSRMRRSGALRASRYKFRGFGIRKVVDIGLSMQAHLGMSPESVTYLESVRALLSLSDSAKQVRSEMLVQLRARKLRSLKTLLALLNAVFQTPWSADRQLDSMDVRHWAIEDLASGYSLIFDLVREEMGLSPDMWTHADEQAAGSAADLYSRLLLNAARLSELREAETMIDGLPYVAVEANGRVVVRAKDPNFERGVRLGYIQMDMQSMHRSRMVLSGPGARNVPTFEAFAENAFDNGLDKLVQQWDVPYSRLVFLIPQSPAFLQPITTDQLFLDEIALLAGAGIDEFKPNEGGSLAITPSLQAIDIVKVQRLFKLIAIAYRKSLASVADERLRNTLMVRSTLPVIQKAQLHSLLGGILSTEKATEILELLTLASDEKFIDIQYRPLIAAGEFVACAPAIAARSNLLRNIVVANRLRKGDSDNDSMQAVIVESLGTAGFRVRASFTFDMNGKRETDIIALRDNKLFVFECKNSFHPCSAHELRTSFEHLETALHQLDIRNAWLSNEANLRKLLSALGWGHDTLPTIHTGILTANRMLTGYRHGRHPVRQAHEFMNVVLRGTIGRSDRATPLKFWRGDTFHADDLVHYLDGRSIAGSQFAQLQPTTRTIKLMSRFLCFETFYMDVEQAADAADAEFGLNTAPDRQISISEEVARDP